jgi:hypothetical protein
MDIPISAKRPETLTQAYHAGVLVSMVENYLPNENIPSIVTCLVHFHALREVLGDRLWQKLKTKPRFAPRVRVYESLTYQPMLPKSMIGGSRDFFLGYVRSYENSTLKSKTDKERQKDVQRILDYLSMHQ